MGGRVGGKRSTIVSMLNFDLFFFPCVVEAKLLASCFAFCLSLYYTQSAKRTNVCIYMLTRLFSCVSFSFSPLMAHAQDKILSRDASKEKVI